MTDQPRTNVTYVDGDDGRQLIPDVQAESVSDDTPLMWPPYLEEEADKAGKQEK
jgi:hypothetical protein